MLSNLVLVMFIVRLSIDLVAASLFDPHRFPEAGPFFERWHIRIIDPERNMSFALTFGMVEPEILDNNKNLAMVSLTQNKGKGPMKTYKSFPKVDDVEVTIRNGATVVEQPDKKHTASFQWHSPEGKFIVNSSMAEFNFTFAGVKFYGRLDRGEPWASKGSGPESWLHKLPSHDYHWFVYSVASKVLEYTWQVSDQAEVKNSSIAMAHAEKQWGTSFPDTWVWMQGINKTNNVSFAAGYGMVKFKIANLQGFAVGYKHISKEINLRFRRDQSGIKVIIDGCKANVTIRVRGIKYILRIETTVSPESVTNCTYVPKKAGFKPEAFNTFSAESYITLYKLKWNLHWELIDDQQVNMVALELGGQYACKQPQAACKDDKK